MTFEHFRGLELVFNALALQKDYDLRAIILAGKGKHFCAGLDLESAMWMGEMRN
jgi:enoyl-CoA hydratase/carnithine racemase